MKWTVSISTDDTDRRRASRRLRAAIRYLAAVFGLRAEIVREEPEQ